jgi:hypothetical protein
MNLTKKIAMITVVLFTSTGMAFADNDGNNGNNGNNGNSNFSSPTFGSTSLTGGVFAFSGTAGFAATTGNTENGTGFSGVRNTSGATQFSGVELTLGESATGPTNGTSTWARTLTADTASFGTNYSTTYVEQDGSSTKGWGSSGGLNVGAGAGWGTFGTFNN